MCFLIYVFLWHKVFKVINYGIWSCFSFCPDMCEECVNYIYQFTNHFTKHILKLYTTRNKSFHVTPEWHENATMSATNWRGCAWRGMSGAYHVGLDRRDKYTMLALDRRGNLPHRSWTDVVSIWISYYVGPRLM